MTAWVHMRRPGPAARVLLLLLGTAACIAAETSQTYATDSNRGHGSMWLTAREAALEEPQQAQQRYLHFSAAGGASGPGRLAVTAVATHPARKPAASIHNLEPSTWSMMQQVPVKGRALWADELGAAGDAPVSAAAMQVPTEQQYGEMHTGHDSSSDGRGRGRAVWENSAEEDSMAAAGKASVAVSTSRKATASSAHTAGKSSSAGHHGSQHAHEQNDHDSDDDGESDSDDGDSDDSGDADSDGDEADNSEDGNRWDDDEDDSSSSSSSGSGGADYGGSSYPSKQPSSPHATKWQQSSAVIQHWVKQDGYAKHHKGGYKGGYKGSHKPSKPVFTPGHQTPYQGGAQAEVVAEWPGYAPWGDEGHNGYGYDGDDANSYDSYGDSSAGGSDGDASGGYDGDSGEGKQHSHHGRSSIGGWKFTKGDRAEDGGDNVGDGGDDSEDDSSGTDAAGSDEDAELDNSSSSRYTYQKKHRKGHGKHHKQQQHMQEEDGEDGGEESEADSDEDESESDDSSGDGSDEANLEGEEQNDEDAEGEAHDEDDIEDETNDDGDHTGGNKGKGGHGKHSKKRRSKSRFVSHKSGAQQKFKTGDIHQRIDIAEIDEMADTNPYRVLMLLAWQEMMACRDMSDPYGYWPLAGVHGLGWEYNGHKPSKMGFCKHASPSFAGWHRPYVWAFEQGLIQHAANVVKRLKTPELREQYGEVLEKLRLPYWDFTNPHVPHILRDKEVCVIDNAGNRITISNPLATFKYPRSPGGGVSAYTTRSSKWILGVHRGAGPWAKELASFVRSRDFDCTYNGPARCPGNLEQVHNSIHSTLGSAEGELGKSEYSAFDPLFWLLHSAVDRCIWLFQNNNHDNGEGWVEPDTYMPFYPPGNPEHVGELGYTYRDPHAISSRGRRLLASNPNAVPDTVSGPNAGHTVGSAAAKAALQRALAHWTGGYDGFQWQVQFTQLKRYQNVKKPANVFVLLKDMPNAPPLPSATGTARISPDDVRARADFCGSVEGFSDDIDMANKTRAVSAAVDLTDCLQRAGIKTAVDPVNAADVKSGPRKAAVKLSQLKFYALAPDGTDMSKSFDFGKTVISWTRPIQSQRSTLAATPKDGLTVKAVGDKSPEMVYTQAFGVL